MNAPGFSNAPSPPQTLPPWVPANAQFSLVAGATGVRRQQIVAAVAGQMPSPMQRLGLVGMPAMGILPPDTNEVALAFGDRFPAAPSWQLVAPILTMNGMRVTALPTVAQRG